MNRNLADEGIRNAIAAARQSTAKLANLLSKYDEIHFDITAQTTVMEDVAALIAYLKLYAVEDDTKPVAAMYVENGKPCELTIFIHQKMFGTANHMLVLHRIAEFMIASNNAVFKTARKAKICCNCIYGHEEPHCPYAGEVTMYYSCDKWELWQL